MDPPKLPVDMLLRWAREQPDRLWLVQPVAGAERRYTWAQAAEQVGRMAAALQAENWEPGSRVCLSGMNTAHWFLAELAILMAGHVPVGLYPKQAAKATRYILEHSESKAVFLGPMPDGDDFLRCVPAGVLKIRFPYPAAPAGADRTWDAMIHGHAPLTSYARPGPDDLMTLIYTSGTTGDPKGVMLTFGNLSFAVEMLLQAMPARGEERFFSYLPLAHLLERGAVEMASLLYGAEVYFLESLDKMAVQLPKVAPTRFYAVPLVWGRFQTGVLGKLSPRTLDVLTSIPIVATLVRQFLLRSMGLQNVRIAVSGAAPLPLATMEWFKRVLGIEILQGYGMTENTAYASFCLPGQNRLGSVGRPLPGSNLKLSEEGEILVRHPAVMKGYYKEPEKTAEVFTPDGWLRTGDKGRLDDEGYLYITGRVKDIFKTAKGKYVAPAPIENAMARNTDIDQLCLVGMNLNQPVMVVTLTPEARKKPRTETEHALLATVKDVNAELEAHEQIAKVLVAKDTWTIEDGVMTPTMKVKRSEVERRYDAWIQREGAVRSQMAWE